MTQTEQMSDIFVEAKSLFGEMKTLHQSMIERQAIWEKLIDSQTQNNRERLELIDRRWGNLMKVVVILISIFLMSFVRDTIAISNRPTKDDVQRILIENDYSSKSDVMRGTNSVIDDVYSTLERETKMTHEKSKLESENAKINANRQITGYTPRGN